MNHIKNLKYLKSNDIHFYSGWILLILGLVLFVIGEFFWFYILPYQFFISIGFIMLGGMIAFIPSATRSKDEDLDFAIKKYVEDMSVKVVNDLEKKLKNSTEPPIVFGRYLLDGEGVIVRKGRQDQKYRSSIYSGAIIAFKKDSLYILQHTVSLISNDEGQRVMDIPYSDNPQARVEDIITSVQAKNALQKKEHILIINYAQGNEIKIPIVNSMMVDEFCDHLNKEVKGAMR